MLTIYLLLTIALILWFLMKRTYSYWERKGFPYIKPTIPFGNLDAVRRREKSFGSAIHDLYESTNEPFIGIYLLFRPALLIRDPELVKSILTKDFASFHDRGVHVDESDHMTQNLFALPGTKWKQLRSKLTPAFTSGKLRNMFETTENVGKTMIDYLNHLVPMDRKGEIIDMKDTAGKYAIDIIANVIFGLDVNSFAEPDNNFRFGLRRVLDNTFMNFIRSIGGFLCPGLFKFIPISPTDPYIRKFMTDIVKKTIAYRENTNYVRKDFMQLLLQLRNTGKLNIDDTIWDVETVADNLKSMSIEMCAAQLFLFYIAGSETTSAAISYCLYELTQNKEIMKKLVEEIDRTLEKNDGRVTYDVIQNMKYLDLCLMETLRKYPGLPILNRECNENFNIPGTNHTIEKGTSIIISLLGLHRDPNNFPEPLKFDPERYAEGGTNYVEAAYLPFGEGPRACIGIRMGKVNAKAALVMLLSKFEFEAIEQKEMEFANHAVTILPKDGIKLKVTRRKKNSKLG